MELEVKSVVELMRFAASYKDDDTAQHVLMALLHVKPTDSVDDLARSVLGSVADGLGVSLD